MRQGTTDYTCETIYAPVVKFFFLLLRRTQISTLFPYTTLFRSADAGLPPVPALRRAPVSHSRAGRAAHRGPGGDRKSTRLNSSHMSSSYAVFCFKKKTNTSGVLIFDSGEFKGGSLFVGLQIRAN